MMVALSTALAGSDKLARGALPRRNRIERFAGLLGAWRLKFSRRKDGKRTTHNPSQPSVEPALALTGDYRDLLFPMTRHDFEPFDQRWPGVRTRVAATGHHPVRLGAGHDQDDGAVVTGLRHGGRLASVDASTDVLSLAIRYLVVRLRLPKSDALAMPWDLSHRHSVTALRYLLDGAFGDDPVLFSLLGNTLARVDDDHGMLSRLAAELLRPQDRLLLEVATTPGLSDELATRAAEEHRSREILTALGTNALRRLTNLPLDKNSVQHTASVEDDRALLVKASYHNQTSTEIMITLANGGRVTFKPGDTIRLAMVRKYTKGGLDDMLAASGLTNIGDWHSEASATTPGFGLTLRLLARKTQDAQPAATPATTLADHLWRR